MRTFNIIAKKRKKSYNMARGQELEFASQRSGFQSALALTCCVTLCQFNLSEPQFPLGVVDNKVLFPTVIIRIR